PLAVLQNRLESLFRKPEATIMESSENIASSLEEVRNMRMLTSNLMDLARRDDGIKVENAATEPCFFDSILENFTIIAEENNRSLIAKSN
ncbi:sensor histidine kinase, partial [Streptococcus pyogenes]